jgi:hypothetical protein
MREPSLPTAWKSMVIGSRKAGDDDRLFAQLKAGFGVDGVVAIFRSRKAIRRSGELPSVPQRDTGECDAIRSVRGLITIDRDLVLWETGQRFSFKRPVTEHSSCFYALRRSARLVMSSYWRAGPTKAFTSPITRFSVSSALSGSAV